MLVRGWRRSDLAVHMARDVAIQVASDVASDVAAEGSRHQERLSPFPCGRVCGGKGSTSIAAVASSLPPGRAEHAKGDIGPHLAYGRYVAPSVHTRSSSSWRLNGLGKSTAPMSW